MAPAARARSTRGDGGPEQDPRAAVAARRRRRLARLGAALLGLAAALGAAELGFRWLLFGEGELAREWGERLRRPGFYCDPDADGDYWRLHRMWLPPELRERYIGRDELLGWRSYLFDETREHRARAQLSGRRPLLMYGDSFTACMQKAIDCWQGLMHRSEAGRDWCVVNYGVHAYGLDQIYLLVRDSLDLWADERPVVAVGILVDNDLDRMLLDFRGCPKPVLDLEDGALTVRAPGTQDIDEWVAAHPPRAPSWLWRYVSRRRGFLPRALVHPRGDDPRLIVRKQELARAVLAALQQELTRRGLEHFVILFHAPESARPGVSAGWRDAFLRATLSELGIPFVSSRVALHEHMRASGRPLADYYLQERPWDGHYNELGNEAVFPAILRGLRGEFDGPRGEAGRGASATPSGRAR